MWELLLGRVGVAVCCEEAPRWPQAMAKRWVAPLAPSSGCGAGGGRGRQSDSPLLLAGTRIIYDHKFLLECKSSPVARTPPCCLPQTPGATSLAQSSLVKLEELKERNESEEAVPGEQLSTVQPLPAGDTVGLP